MQKYTLKFITLSLQLSYVEATIVVQNFNGHDNPIKTAIAT